MTSEFLVNYENHFGFTAKQAAQVLGIAYATYAAYKNMTRELPIYHVDKVILLCNCSKAMQKQFVDWKLNGQG